MSNQPKLRFRIDDFPLVLSAAPAEAQPRPTPINLYRPQG
jgi:hypothetical protein